jgi:type VII secretion-associated serine protease mycosin
VTASNDQYRSDQWALDGFKAETAVWPITTGAGVRVAVIDSGVQSNHPDLSGRLLSGVDFVADGSGSTPNTTDPLGHGTHVTGIIAAVAGNGIGVAGLAPSVRVIPVRVLDENGAGWSADIAKGIVYAVDAGAHVINLSLGGSRSSVIGSAVTYAHAQGVTVTAAMGNSKQQGNPTSYPAANLESIAVAAASSSGSVASFSNTGDHVDVAAPGVAIKSTVSSGGYATYSGTSMATPYVSALAALMLAKSPGLTPDQVRSVMQGAAKNLGSPGWDTQSGHGLINPSAVLDPDPSSPSLDPDPSSPSLDPDPSSPTPELVAPTQSEEAVDSPVYWVKPKITSEPRNDSAKAGRKVRFRTKFVAQGDVSMTWQFKTVNGKKRKLPGRASVVIQSDRTKIKIVQLKNKWSGAKVQAIVANSSGEARSRWARIKIG